MKIIPLKHYCNFLFIPLFLWGCSLSHPAAQYRKLPPQDKQRIDSLLLAALDHEALYTLLDTIKPISSMEMVRYPLAPDSTHLPGTVSPIKNPLYVDSLDRYYWLTNKLSGGKVTFVMMPFKAADKQYKNIQLYAVRNLILQKVIAEQADFFGQLGITPHTPANTVIAIVEHAQAYDRWRGYGYLFGYPNHAVDFFVEAGKSQDSTGNFVERQFFHMPVYAGTSGYFTYALPKSATPGSIDSTIYRHASYKLEQYKRDRKKWVGQKKMKTVKILKRIDKPRL